MGSATSAAFGGQEQIYITRRRSKSIALIGQQSFNKPEFFVRNRHGAANVFSPQPFLVAPSFDREDRPFQKEHVNPLVYEGVAESVGPSIGSTLELGHPVQSLVLPVFMIGSLSHIFIVPQKSQFLQRATLFSADK